MTSPSYIEKAVTAASGADLSTLSGQALHYAGVRARLRAGGARAPRLAPVTAVQTIPSPPPSVTPEFPDVPAPLNVEKLPDYHTAADRIIAEVADKHGLTVPEVKSDRRAATIIDARYEAFYRLAKETPLSLPQIGRKFGGFDHTTVLHGIRKHEQRTAAGTTKRNWYNARVNPKPATREPIWGVGGWR